MAKTLLRELVLGTPLHAFYLLRYSVLISAPYRCQ